MMVFHITHTEFHYTLVKYLNSETHSVSYFIQLLYKQRVTMDRHLTVSNFFVYVCLCVHTHVHNMPGNECE